MPEPSRPTPPAPVDHVGVEREEAGPGDLDRDDWKQVAKRVVPRIKGDQVVLLGAGVAFFGLLALIPGLIAAVSIYGLVSDPSDVQRQVENLTDALPAAAREIIEEQLQSIVDSSAANLSLGALFGLLAALWSASSGVSHLIGALNVAYREDEDRGFVKLRGVSLLLTLGGIVFAVFAVGAIAVIPVIVNGTVVDGAVATALQWLRWPLLLLAFMAALALLYKVGPDRENPRVAWASWGAGIATVVWVVGSAGFSFYVSQFGNFNETYGSLAGVIVLMLWLVLTATVVIIGALINAELEHQTAVDTTTGEPRPIGQRDAQVADTVAERVRATPVPD